MTLRAVLLMAVVLVLAFLAGFIDKKASIVTWFNGLLILCGMILFAGGDPDRLTTPLRIAVAAVVAIVGTIVLLKVRRKYRDENRGL